jgi:hypothetical protein
VVVMAGSSHFRVPSNSALLTDAYLKALRALSGAAKRGR